MQLEGLHHVTMITADAQRTVDFAVGVLGLRMVKQTVNFDQPDAYHLYFGDEHGAPGSLLTWFEFPRVGRGRAGAGMVHTIRLAVPSPASLEFWADRLAAADLPVRRHAGAVGFADAEGLVFELAVAPEGAAPLRAEHPDVPAEHAILGVSGARAFRAAADDRVLTETLGFMAARDGGHRLGNATWDYDSAPPERGRPGAGTVHHIAWTSRDEDHAAWQRRVRDAGLQVTDVRDRDYFKSIYFREPHGVLFELATPSPGFAVDEDPDRLGEALRLPQRHAHLRERLERTLAPLVDPRARDGAAA